MAKSGTIKVRVTDYDELSFVWERTGVSVEKNTSTISWRMVLTSTAYGAITSSVAKAWSVNIDGKAYSGTNTIAIGNNATKVLAQGTTTIAHDYDGTKTFAIKFSQAFAITFAGAYIGTISKETAATLDTIKRSATIISAADFTDEGNPSFTYSTITGIKQLLCNVSWDGIAYISNRVIPTTGSSFVFSLTDTERKTLREAMANANSMTVTYTLVTVFADGTTMLSAKDATAKIINATPTVTDVSIFDNGETAIATGNSNVLVRSKSDAFVMVYVETQKGAGVASIVIKNGSQSIVGSVYNVEVNASGGKNAQSDCQFDNVESGTFVVEVTDTRGNKASRTIRKELIDYIPLTIAIDDFEVNASGSVAFSVGGDFFNGSLGANNNELSVWCGITKKGETSYIVTADINPTINDNTFSASILFEGLDYTQEYTLHVHARDNMYTNFMPSLTVTRDFVSQTIFDWGKDDFQFNVPVHFGAGAFIGGKSISAGTDAGEWIPRLTDPSAVSSYEVQGGWWQKVGNVVTIGWQIKATCKSGYHTTPLSIGNVPFIPSVSAFGGGVAHNIYITGGFCFEGWAIDTGKTISARLQPCNSTSAGNLQIASTSYYPTGGGTITLAGTICFTTDE